VKTDFVWQELYRAALIETDDKNLSSRLQASMAAIDARLQEMQQQHGGTPEERQAISDTLAGLNVMRRELANRSSEEASASPETAGKRTDHLELNGPANSR
jgi:hypothetical protein